MRGAAMVDRDEIAFLADLVGPFAPGVVSLVGAGPGDPTLISVRGAVRIAQADVILHDRLANPALLRLASDEAELVAVGKMPDRHPIPQDEIQQKRQRQNIPGCIPIHQILTACLFSNDRDRVLIDLSTKETNRPTSILLASGVFNDRLLQFRMSSFSSARRLQTHTDDSVAGGRDSS